MTDYECAVIFRAALIRQANALKEQRDTVLEQVAALEQRWGLGKYARQPVANEVVALPQMHTSEMASVKE